MAGHEETEEVQSPFNFWELIAMLDEDHKLEIVELKDKLEEKEEEVSRLNKELEKKEAARKEADERAVFWYRMNETMEKVMRMKYQQIPKEAVSKNDPFLEIGQRKPGRMKDVKAKNVTNLKKRQNLQMMNLKTNPMMSPMQRQRNMIMNQKTMQTMMTMQPMMTMPNIQPTLQMMNLKTNPMMSPMQRQRNLIMNQKTMQPMMTMPTSQPILYRTDLMRLEGGE